MHLTFHNHLAFVSEHVGNAQHHAPWLTLLAIDGVDFTGGQTLIETAEQLEQRGVVFAITDVTTSGGSSPATGRRRHVAAAGRFDRAVPRVQHFRQFTAFPPSFELRRSKSRRHL